MNHPQIGHVHLKVSDLGRSIEFYTSAFGLTVMQRYGDSAAFLSWGGYHHHLGLNTWNSKGQAPAPKTAPGLYHFAVLYPDRKSLGIAVKRALDFNVPIEGASDHGVSEAVYFLDPDGNGIELYRDRPRSEWPFKNGELKMVIEPLDVDELVRLADTSDLSQGTFLE